MPVRWGGRLPQLGTPDEIYRRPVDRFVASFVGDVNVLHARLERIDAAVAMVALRAARVRAASRPLQGAAIGSMVDLFVRPEELRPAEPGVAVAARGIVAAQIYQGAHVELYVDAPGGLSGRVLLRVPRQEGMSVWPGGTRISIALPADDGIAVKSAG